MVVHGDTPVYGTYPCLLYTSDAADTDHTRDVIARKYGILGWLTMKGSLLRRGKTGTIGLAVTADDRRG